MDAELEFIAEKIGGVSCPEDIFGTIGEKGDSAQKKSKLLGKEFKRLARKVHEDLYSHPTDKAIAHNAFIELGRMHDRANERIKAGVYGDRTKVISSPDGAASSDPVLIKGKYSRYASFAAGDIADLHAAYHEVVGKRHEVLLKYARDEADNELLEAERDHLEDLHKKLDDKIKDPNSWQNAIPRVFDSFRIDDGTGSKRRMNVLEKFDGFYSVEQIRTLLPNGVDGRTVAWMWKRLILLIDWTYRLGYVHGAVLPPHVMFYPDNDGATFRDVRKHSIRLVDWCYSRKLGAGVKLLAWAPQYKDYYAPEVINKTALGPWTDLYMGAKTMLLLIGGDPVKNVFPAHIPKEIAACIRKCLEVDPRLRPRDPQDYFDEFTQVLKGVYGASKYHDFNLPR